MGIKKNSCFQNFFSVIRAQNGHNLHPAVPAVRGSLRLVGVSHLITTAEKLARNVDERQTYESIGEFSSTSTVLYESE